MTSSPSAPTQMSREIAEQPDTLAATIESASAVRGEVRRLASDVDRLLLFGRGSSANAAVYGEFLCQAVAGRPASVGAPSAATLYDAPLDLRGSLVVVLSQSGRTQELVDVADWARARGARIVGVTNDAASPLAAAVDVLMPVAAGTERAVPATKTYTAQLVALAVLVTTLWPSAEIESGLHDVPEQARALLVATGVDAAVELLAPATGLVLSGRGPTLTTARELALKVQETCRLPAVPLSSADLQHGPVALLGPEVPLVVAAGGDRTVPGLVSVARTARARGSPVLALGGDARLQRHADLALPGPRLPAALAPVVGVIAGQLVVEAMARRRGLDPDLPSGLTKVTQTA
ncbi:MAG: hypothetical protein QOJ60_3258 [Actinomycetota bacterium]|nr:hypothetical protein [Actinomycetota bacterium]